MTGDDWWHRPDHERRARTARRPRRSGMAPRGASRRSGPRGGLTAVVVWSRRERGVGWGVVSGGGGGGAAAASRWVYLRVCRPHGGARWVQGDLSLWGWRGGGVARRARSRDHDARRRAHGR